MKLKWPLALGAILAGLCGQGANAQTCGGAIPGEFSVYRDSAGSVLYQANGVDGSAGAYLQLNACLNYAPSGGQGKYFTGTVTNIFLDHEGHYLASNGQGLTDSYGMALPTFVPRPFGAGAGLGYTLASAASVATKVLVQASIVDCASAAIASCSGTPKPYLWLF